MTDEFTWDRTVYRDKFGRVIQADELECLLRNPEYRIVAQDWIGDFLVSTVWLGVPYDLGISYFETMVFDTNNPIGERSLDLVRYENLSQAEEGHAEMLARWKEQLTQADVSQSIDHSTGHPSQEC
jgi:hypothetical protein